MDIAEHIVRSATALGYVVHAERLYVRRRTLGAGRSLGELAPHAADIVVLDGDDGVVRTRQRQYRSTVQRQRIGIHHRRLDPMLFREGIGGLEATVHHVATSGEHDALGTSGGAPQHLVPRERKALPLIV